MTESIFDPVVIVVGRSDIERGDVSFTLEALNVLKQSPEAARAYRERVDIAFHGYDDRPDELFEIDEVREFVRRLDAKFPYWIYFLSKHYSGLQCIALCLLPPYLTREGKAKHFPERLQQLVDVRWGPAAEQMCAYAGLPGSEFTQIVERFALYISEGPLPEQS